MGTTVFFKVLEYYPGTKFSAAAMRAAAMAA
jgi:hypothetical protein